uniref:Conotoxin Au11.6 n=1 Tax=Conus aulicus TaxID=89437 RepID=I1B6_CONAL|nr:RecName: Full=Conotoxin Au11.6 [Conus aulicus]
GDWGTCSWPGQECEHDSDCCGSFCCVGRRCLHIYFPCNLSRS